MDFNIIFSGITEDDTKYSDIKDTVTDAVGGVLEYMKADGRYEISVTITDNEEIRELNRTYRNIDKATDVLSFPIYDLQAEELPDGEETVLLGDIVISYEKAVEQAEEYGHSVRRETAFLCVHSMLHLLGYDHEKSEEDEKIMFDLQDKIMEYINISRED